MLTVFVEDSFDSAHWLPNVPDDHKCKRLHGHTYNIRIEINGRTGKSSGWIIDYTDVKAIWDETKDLIDHRCINDIEGLENSTCENLVQWIAKRLQRQLPGLCKVEIRETVHCGAIWAAE